MDEQQQPRWRPIRKQILWTGSITTLAFVLFVICVYLFGWKWTGLPKETFWDWMKLLIVPALIAAGGLWFNWQQEKRQREEGLQQQERGLAIESQRARDEALQAYLDKMTDLLVVHKLGKQRLLKHKLQGDSVRDPVRTVARARTKTVLRRLDGERRGAVLRFLTEAGLIKKGCPVIGSVAGAHLVDADLKKSVLRDTALQGVDLSRANLSGADLSGSDLTEANLYVADLEGADLRGANLNEERWPQEKGWPEEWLEYLEDEAKSLKAATLPNGQKYEAWLKDREGR